MKKTLLLLLLLAPFFTFAQWNQVGVDIDGESAGDKSGSSVSLSNDGSIVAIGDFQASNIGQVRVFKNTSGVWNQIGSNIEGESSYDSFGYSVSLSSDGSKVAIGGFSNDGAGQASGHTRIYENIDGIWTQLGFDIDGEAADDRSGYSVSLSSDGSIVAIGAWKNAGNGMQSGHVRIYQYISEAWVQIGADIDGEAAQDWSGKAVSLSSDGSIVAIGAMVNYNGNGYNGHVRVFENISNSWIQRGPDIDAESYEDRFGASVSLSSDGNILAIGGVYNDANGSNSGHVRVYQYSTNTWTQIGPDIDGEATGDQSGWSVSLSSDGNILAVGALYNSNSNGSFSGQARVYKYSTNTWTQIGVDIDGEAEKDYFGSSISLSSDGTILAVGASWNDGVNGVDSGHVRVFSNNSLLSVTSNSFGPQFNVFPNPSFGSTNIELGDFHKEVKVLIFNLLGKEIMHKTYNNTNKINLNTQQFSTGIYIVKVEADISVASLKLVIK